MGSVSGGGGDDEDEDLKADLDMHSLILNSNPCENEASKTYFFECNCITHE